MTTRFISAITPPDATHQGSLWFLFQGNRLLVVREGNQTDILRLRSPEDIGLPPVQAHYLGLLNGADGEARCFCGEIADDVQPPVGMVFENLRPLYTQLDETLFWLAGRAVQIVDWDRTNRFCGRCGQQTIDQASDRSKLCPNCGLTSYPRLAPAVIVRIQRTTDTGPEILLARARRFPGAMFSVLAGFVEPGETLEECVQREIMEEVGITVENITYFGSQPWPFPHSLMIGFTADLADCELHIDPNDIAEAAWFPPGELPLVPPPPSIANRLITTWLEGIS